MVPLRSMKNAFRLTVVLGVLLLGGCAASQSTTSSTAGGPSDTTDSLSATSQAQSDADTVATDPTRETAPQDWFHKGPESRSIPGLATERAYNTVLDGRSPQDTVVVAVIDSGIDVEHEDLSGTAWTNPDEIPDNERDDDSNGYVDDVHGWNFIGGPDGKNVNHDTYELTRLYVDLRERFAGVDSANVPASDQDAYQRFQRLRRTFRDKREQAQKELKNVRKARDAVKSASKILKDHLDTDRLTQERVASVAAVTQEVQRAQDILLYFYEQDLTPDEISEYYNHVRDKVEYNYNPDFNPRPIVGDDYSDKTEQYYGNSDVTGPDAGHGTHVAGIIGAERNNGIGMDGVARGVQIMSVRAVPNGDERDKDIASAIRYAAANGADIINMSFGKGYSPHKTVVDDAVQYADSLGVLMVHAAGNDGANVDTTDNFPTGQYRSGGRASLWIEVGASSWRADSTLAAPFTNYGSETVDVFAPGDAIYSTSPSNEYGRSSGTSMAAPMVSGLAALLMAHYPHLSPHQIHDIILETATSYEDVQVIQPGKSSELVPFGDLSRTGSIVNAPAALRRAEQMSAQHTRSR